MESGELETPLKQNNFNKFYYNFSQKKQRNI
jgi:hypothetical protein